MKSLIEIGFAWVAVEDFRQHLPCGVSCPASQTKTLLALRADERFADEPAEPPPTII